MREWLLSLFGAAAIAIAASGKAGSRNRVRYRVHYAIADYEGDVIVFADENDEREHVIALAERELQRKTGPLPFGARSYQIERLYDPEE
jgi:hypothetical protein